MTRRSMMCIAVGIVSLLIPACQPDDLAGPPTIRLGRDECAGCGMLVSEERSSCALLVEQDGARAHLVFDDPGCLLDYRADHPETAIVSTFVHDFASGAWIDADAARFLIAAPDALSTPMGSGIVAFATQESAASQRTKSGGQTAGYERLIEARRTWRDARRTTHPTPGSPPH